MSETIDLERLVQALSTALVDAQARIERMESTIDFLWERIEQLQEARDERQ